LGRPLARCLDNSPWPFTRAQLLINIKGFYKIFHSPFVETRPPKYVHWLDAATVQQHRLFSRSADSPYMFYTKRPDSTPTTRDRYW
jgi:hypothetical protein